VSPATRRRLGVVLTGLASLLVGLTLLSGYLRWEVVDSDAFSRRAASALDDRSVRETLAEQIVDALATKAAPSVLIVRPVAVAGVAALIDTAPFRRTFQRAVRARHETLLEGRERFELSLIPRDRLLGDLIGLVATKASGLLAREVRLPALTLDPRSFELRLARALDGAAAWFWPLVVLTVLAGGASAGLAASGRDALGRLGMAVGGGGLLVAAVVAGLGGYVESHAANPVGLADETERAAVHALWAALFGDLRTSGLLTAAGGAVIATLAAGDRAARSFARAGDSARRALRSPSPRARRARAVVAIGLGAALFVQPSLTVRILAVGAGVLLALTGSSRSPDACRAPRHRARALHRDPSSVPRSAPWGC
jgi:hypothetical protein